jgi:hypothetical protein
VAVLFPGRFHTRRLVIEKRREEKRREAPLLKDNLLVIKLKNNGYSANRRADGAVHEQNKYIKIKFIGNYLDENLTIKICVVFVVKFLLYKVIP